MKSLNTPAQAGTSSQNISLTGADKIGRIAAIDGTGGKLQDVRARSKKPGEYVLSPLAPRYVITRLARVRLDDTDNVRISGAIGRVETYRPGIGSCC